MEKRRDQPNYRWNEDLVAAIHDMFGTKRKFAGYLGVPVERIDLLIEGDPLEPVWGWDDCFEEPTYSPTMLAIQVSHALGAMIEDVFPKYLYPVPQWSQIPQKALQGPQGEQRMDLSI